MRLFRRRLERTVSAIVTAGFFVGALPAQSPDLDRWRGMISAAGEQMRKAHFRDAEQNLQSALEQARHLRPLLVPEATTYNNLGTLFWRMHKYDESAAAYQRSLHLWGKTGQSGNRYFLHTANNLIGLYVERGNVKRAEYQAGFALCPSGSRLDGEIRVLQALTFRVAHQHGDQPRSRPSGSLTMVDITPGPDTH